MKRKIRVTLLFLTILILCLSGCAKEQSLTADKNTIIIKEDGSIVGYISEEFDEDLYSYDELEALTTSEIEKYNAAVSEEAVVLEQSELTQGRITMSISYRNAEDYQAFNHEFFFFGTVEEAIAAGYDLTQLVLCDASDSGQVVDGTGISSLTDHLIVITEDDSNIRGYQRIAYLEQGDILVNQYEVETTVRETEDSGIILHCVVFK